MGKALMQFDRSYNYYGTIYTYVKAVVQYNGRKASTLKYEPEGVSG